MGGWRQTSYKQHGCTQDAGTELPRYPECSLEIKYATEHRCGVVIHGPGLSDAVTGTDPLKDGLPLLSCEPRDASTEVRRGLAKLCLQCGNTVAVAPLPCLHTVL